MLTVRIARIDMDVYRVYWNNGGAYAILDELL